MPCKEDVSSVEAILVVCLTWSSSLRWSLGL